jgi:methanogenic corrinoid protein MtbC1
MLSTLPGDSHRLGLQMAAMVCALAGLKVIYLGPSTPLSEIAQGARRLGAKAVLLSAALGTDMDLAAKQLDVLRKLLPEGAVLGVGGAGAPRPTDAKAWQRFGDLDAFFQWLRAWRASFEAPGPRDAVR